MAATTSTTAEVTKALVQYRVEDGVAVITLPNGLETYDFRIHSRRVRPVRSPLRKGQADRSSAK